jgi:hypothetical protein
MLGLARFREKLLYRSRSLADALFVLDERDAYEALAMLAESDAG